MNKKLIASTLVVASIAATSIFASNSFASDKPTMTPQKILSSEEIHSLKEQVGTIQTEHGIYERTDSTQDLTGPDVVQGVANANESTKVIIDHGGFVKK